MPTPLIIPTDLWEEHDTTGSSLIWLVDDGAVVQEGDLVAELLVEKLTMELEAPATGRLRIIASPQNVVNRGDMVAMIV